jgi:ArsR family transcriptional regulator, virulence genes transcriptional regulator
MGARVATKAQVAPGAVRLAIDPDELSAHAETAAALLRAMSGKSRLLVLCNLVEGERSVGELQRIVGLSQSALSQHLAVLRRSKLVETRRETQTIYYRLAGGAASAVLETLHGLYCAPPAAAKARGR